MVLEVLDSVPMKEIDFRKEKTVLHFLEDSPVRGVFKASDTSRLKLRGAFEDADADMIVVKFIPCYDKNIES